MINAQMSIKLSIFSNPSNDLESDWSELAILADHSVVFSPWFFEALREYALDFNIIRPTTSTLLWGYRIASDKSQLFVF